ncbi:MAG TPA: aminotransferase class I/II-fold pyridoxal phosphate-dependent enzyme [Gaiellaceae bacterium]|nr:aminotransferase class I/II-fold pyridoxal phosphate-dependent enzyme [Gaiellaceae bacterium]
MATYPFVRLDEAKASLRARGVGLVDFGMGEPNEETDPAIRQALVEAVAPKLMYPRAQGLPELRAAIGAWLRLRFGVEVDPEREIVPTLGSKEAIFSFAQVVVGPGKNVVAIPEPAYPVYERGALVAAAEPYPVPLHESRGFLPDLDAIPDEIWDRIACFWVNYPNNPTGAVAPVTFYDELAARAEAHDFLVCSDEAYSEIWFDETPVSALQAVDRSRIVVFNTLSKRSSMPGYRSGFLAGPAELVAALKSFRPTTGTAPQEFVQRASIVAWSDEEHVRRTRALYRRKRELIRPALEAKGLRIAGSEASFFLWVAVPGGETSEGFAGRLLEHGVVVAPGSFFGPAGEGYVRLALVPTEDECARAAHIIEEVL